MSSASGGDGGPLTGTITFAQSDDQLSFGAVFHPVFSACSAAPTSAAACSITSCTPDALQWADDAGDLTIAGGDIPPGTTVHNSGFGDYSYLGTGTWMKPGQSITVEGAGGQVPAFGPWTVTVPQPVTLTAPPFTDGGATTVSVSSDLIVAWTGAQSGTMVTFRLLGPTPFSALTCTWDAATGQGTIPKALLAEVAGPQIGNMSPMTYAVQATNTFTAGLYTIAVTAALGSGWLITFQ